MYIYVNIAIDPTFSATLKNNSVRYRKCRVPNNSFETVSLVSIVLPGK